MAIEIKSPTKLRIKFSNIDEFIKLNILAILQPLYTCTRTCLHTADDSYLMDHPYLDV